MFEKFDTAKRYSGVNWYIVFEEENFQEYNPYYSREGGSEYYSSKRIKTTIVEHKDLSNVLRKIITSYRVSKFVSVTATLTTEVNLSLN